MSGDGVEATVVKLSERNQMVLPKAAREALGIQSGERVLVLIKDGEVRLMAEPTDWAEYIYGLGERLWASLGGGEQFLQKERAAWGE
ncbi:MAG: AbrB/MazE/SpoVT family DNA-binding domain-containing protein [Anaerolineae bacterium]